MMLWFTPPPPPPSTTAKRLGQLFVLLRKILLTMNWKHEQGCITIAVEYSHINGFLYFYVLRTRTKLL